VYLIGRLATGVEVKEVNGGSKVSSFILAVDRNAEEADIFRIKAWNSQAEAAGTNRRLLPESHRLPVAAICQARARVPLLFAQTAPSEEDQRIVPRNPSGPDISLDSAELPGVHQPEALDATGP
jgi:hypothetical protein